MANRRITVEFLGKDVSAGSTAAKVEQKFGKLGGRLDRVGQMAGRVLAGGLVLGTAALYKAGQAAAKDEAAAAQLSQTLQKAAGASDTQVAATERWITAQGKALGIADDELRPALARLAVATGDVGEAQSLASLAMDVSAGTGKSLSSVSTALAKAQQGNVSGLQRLGIATKDASGETKSLEQITRDLSKTYGGDAAAAADTVAGRQRKLAVAMSELGEKIGSAVLPAMQKLTDIALRVVGWISQHTTLVGTLVGVVAGFAAVLYAASVAMRVWATTTKVVAAVTKAWTAAQWLLNAAMTANPIGLVIAAIAALVVGLVVAYKKSETFRKIVNAAFGAVASAAKAAFGWIKSAAAATLGWIQSHWRLLLAILTGPIGIAVGIISRHWSTIKAGAQTIIGKVREVASDVRNALVAAFEFAKGRVTSAMSAMLAPIQWVIDKVQQLIGWISRIHVPNISLPDIPGLASGTSYHRGGLAVVGEEGPELVDLPRGTKVIPHRESMGTLRGVSAGGGGVTIVFQGVVGDPRAVAREIQRVLLTEKRLSGRNLGLT